MTASLRDLRVLAQGLDHPEGVATGPDGMIYAGGEAGQVYRIDPGSGQVAELANTGGFVLGLCHDAAGAVYVCDVSERPAIRRVDPATGEVSAYCASADGGPLETPNYAAFAADGTLWFTDSGTEDLDVRNGRLIRVPPDGGDGQVLGLGELHFPNGMCLDAAGRPAFLETLTPRLSVVVDGSAEVVCEFPGNSPDGLALTADGGFLVACYYPFRLLRVPPGGGSYEVVLDDPTGIHIPMPTNVCFFGEGLRQVAIASLGGQVVKAIDLGIAGAAVQYPRLPAPGR
ncbi:MAG TPA: SMP-30/gluconolactonase/LRE family protein [Gaiellales bacterium]|nr:SMP-30/gluconolactonase/LRE family protein [Gaiellales bacterium]